MSFKDAMALTIIGDKVIEYSDTEYTIPLSKFMSRISHENIANWFLGKIFFLGQGLSQDEREYLHSLTLKFPEFHLNYTAVKNEDQRFSHKHKSKNTIISTPKKIDDSLFECELLTDDECALMSDHTTGYHLQGMVLVEAARQMMLSVSERFIFSSSDDDSLYCILNNLNIEFHKFTYPFQVRMTFKINSCTRSRNGAFVVKSVTNFYQGGERVTSVSIDFKLFEKSYLEKLEFKLFQDFCEKVNATDLLDQEKLKQVNG